jgi:hypothetical protein
LPDEFYVVITINTHSGAVQVDTGRLPPMLVRPALAHALDLIDAAVEQVKSETRLVVDGKTVEIELPVFVDDDDE